MECVRFVIVQVFEEVCVCVCVCVCSLLISYTGELAMATIMLLLPFLWPSRPLPPPPFGHKKGSTELTAQVLPDLIKLLLEPDETGVRQAAQLLHELSKKEPSAKAMILNPTAINAIFQAVTSASSAELQKSLSGTVHNLSNDRCALIVDLQGGGGGGGGGGGCYCVFIWTI